MSVLLPQTYLRKVDEKKILTDLKVEQEYNHFAAKKNITPTAVRPFLRTDEGYHVPIGYGFKNFSRVIRKNNNNITPSLETEYDIIDTHNLYEYQEAFLEQGLEKILRNRCTFYALHTGAGKTKLGTYFAAKMSTVTCVVYYGTPIGVQWYDAFRQNTTADVWFVGQTKFDDEKIQKPANPQVIICSVGMIKKLTQSDLDDIGFVIVDEAHQWVTQQRVSKLLELRPDYLLGLSATPKKNPSLSQVTILFFNEIELEKKMLKPHRTFKVLTGIHFSPDKKSNNIWDDIKKFYYKHRERNEKIALLMKALAHKKVLAVTWDVKSSVLPLEKSMIKYDVDYDTFYGNKKKYKNAQTLLGTIGKLGTGFDQNKVVCEGYDGVRFDVLIMIGSTRKKGLYEQIVGRVTRAEEFDVYYIVDDNESIKKHFGVCKSWDIEHAGNIYKVDLTQATNIKQVQQALTEPENIYQQRDEKLRR